MLPNRSPSTQTFRGEEHPWLEGIGAAHCQLQSVFKKREKLIYVESRVMGRKKTSNVCGNEKPAAES